MWYVIQVLKGREQAMGELISRVAADGLLDECFSPRFATERKVQGRFEPCERDLFPGYLIAITKNPAELERTLLGLPEFARVLSQGDAFVPLAREEVELIEAFTRRGERVMPMSQAVKDGDGVVVTEGPLVGLEARISRIDRKRSVAYLEFDLCGHTVGARMGLAVLTPPLYPRGPPGPSLPARGFCRSSLTRERTPKSRRVSQIAVAPSLSAPSLIRRPRWLQVRSTAPS